MRRIGASLRRWRRELAFALLARASFFLLQAGAAAWVLMLLDRALRLGKPARLGAFALGAWVLGAGLYRRLLKPLPRMRAAAVFREAGLRAPALAPYLLSAWELERAAVPAGMSAALAQEHVARARALLEKPTPRVFSWSPSTRERRVLAALLLLCAAFSSRGARLEPRRVLAPWSGRGLDSRLIVEPGDARRPWGENVSIRLRSMEIDAAPRLRLRARGAWRAESPERQGDAFVHALGPLTAPVEYYAELAGERTRSYLLVPVPAPRLSLWRARVHGPSGGSAEIALEPGSELAALRSSLVRLRAVCEGEIVEARLEAPGAVPLPMRPGAAGAWEGSFLVREEGMLRVFWRPRETMFGEQSAFFPLRVLEDEAPEVEILSPALELEISPRERLPVAYQVRDDHGLVSVSLGYRFKGGESKRILRAFPSGTKEFLGDAEWDLSALPPGPVEFWIEAEDVGRPPRKGSSAKGRLILVDFESAHARTEEAWLKAQEGLRDLAGEEARAVRELYGFAASSGAVSRPAGWAAREEELGRRWERAVSELEALGEALRGDPYANAASAERAAQLARRLKHLKGEAVPKAQAASAAGRWEEARVERERLEAGARAAEEALRDQARTQALQDLWSKARQMDQAASELGRSLEGASAKAPPSPQEQRKLREALSSLREQLRALAELVRASAPPREDPEGRKARQAYTLPIGSAERSLERLQAALDRGDWAEAAQAAKKVSEDLARMRAAIADAARASSGRDARAEAWERALGRWREAALEQSRSLESSRAGEERRRDSLRANQDGLLKELAREQAGVLQDARASGFAPEDVLDRMRRVQEEFSAGRVREAPAWLAQTRDALRRLPLSQERSGEAAALADREEALRRRLEGGAEPDPSAGGGEREEALRAQRLSLSAGAEAQEGLAPFLRLGQAEPEVGETLERARSEQRAAEEALSAGSSARAIPSQERALELLEKGLESLAENMKRESGLEGAMENSFKQARPAARPSAAAGAGSDTGFVPLPRAQDYQPPREIRQELERSLQEPRPKELDAVIGDYFRRMSQ